MKTRSKCLLWLCLPLLAGLWGAGQRPGAVAVNAPRVAHSLRIQHRQAIRRKAPRKTKMAITLISSTAQYATLTISYPTVTCLPGDVVLVGVFQPSGGTVSTPPALAGETFTVVLAYTPSGYNTLRVWQMIAASAHTAASLGSFTTSGCTASTEVYRGSAGVDATGIQQGSLSVNLNVVTAHANDLVLVCGTDTNAETGGLVSGYTAGFTQGSTAPFAYSGYANAATPTSGTTVNYSQSLGLGHTFTYALLSLQPSGGGGGTATKPIPKYIINDRARFDPRFY